ncbi:CDP-diacylglycerol--glycerol-3-phosphate 3-phosphatidyltransferase [Ureaplasma urealyticum serovar 11 str. ATCC 33695]|uniref:CDP-diacylglycerol--glycerol-3-phosphate 3-phosphatidyltransferase n=1 Tax=Ureaplasma urealyticum TaxID=2130 RepID=UPI00017503FA|nr:CDP-diacylglycerol--glycerol-3-phosphate 3-phosphatidyltransferase [Ureaplasma urealyticum serovar 11 str. ATCC 33695]
MAKLNFKKNILTSPFFRNIPNIITIFRIFLALICIILLLVDFYIKNLNIVYEVLDANISALRLSATTIFIIAAFSDFLDGYIARKYNLVSNLGKILDPISDKILVNGVLICLTLDHTALAYLTIINILRDIFIDGLRMFASSKKIIIPANIFGKIKSILLFISICFILFLLSLTSSWKNVYLFNIPLFFATSLSIVSAIIYYIDFYKGVKKRGSITKS